MTRRWRGVLVLWLLGSALLLAGCATEEAYRGAGFPGDYRSDVPPAFRNIDPALMQWYTAPYFSPYEMP